MARTQAQVASGAALPFQARVVVDIGSRIQFRRVLCAHEDCIARQGQAIGWIFCRERAAMPVAKLPITSKDAIRTERARGFSEFMENNGELIDRPVSRAVTSIH